MTAVGRPKLPKLSKSVLSLFTRTDCKRQLKLLLSKPIRTEREALGIPPSQPQRYGFTDVTEAGNEWEVQKLAELRHYLDTDALIGAGAMRNVPEGPRYEFTASPLANGLHGAMPGQFLVQPEYEMDSPDFPGGMTFPRLSGLQALTQSYGLTFGKVIPDLIEVHPPGAFSSRVLPSAMSSACHRGTSGFSFGFSTSR